MVTYSDTVAAALLGAYTGLFMGGSRLALQAGDKTVAVVDLPAAPWAEPDGRAVDLLGGWVGHATGNGTVTNYVLRAGEYEERGTVSGPRGDGDMRIDNPILAVGQSVLINSFRKEF